VRPAPPHARWVLHPLTTALALVGLGAFATVPAVVAQRDLAVAAATLLLGGVAGAAAGFANSGST
jgi:hypothetical protein